MVKWVLTVIAVVAGFGVLVVVVGSFLPEGHEARSTITLRQPPDTVWMVVRNFEDYPAWWPDVTVVERLPERNGHEAWRQRDRRNQSLPLEVIESEPPSLLVTKIIDEGLPFGGTWTYEIENVESGSTVTITERGEIHNLLFRVIARLIIGEHRTMDRYLTALGRMFDEDVTPTHLE